MRQDRPSCTAQRVAAQRARLDGGSRGLLVIAAPASRDDLP